MHLIKTTRTARHFRLVDGRIVTSHDNGYVRRYNNGNNYQLNPKRIVNGSTVRVMLPSEEERLEFIHRYELKNCDVTIIAQRSINP